MRWFTSLAVGALSVAMLVEAIVDGSWMALGFAVFLLARATSMWVFRRSADEDDFAPTHRQWKTMAAAHALAAGVFTISAITETPWALVGTVVSCAWAVLTYLGTRVEARSA